MPLSPLEYLRHILDEADYLMDYDIVWDVVQNKILQLRQEILEILEKEK